MLILTNEKLHIFVSFPIPERFLPKMSGVKKKTWSFVEWLNGMEV